MIPRGGGGFWPLARLMMMARQQRCSTACPAAAPQRPPLQRTRRGSGSTPGPRIQNVPTEASLHRRLCWWAEPNISKVQGVILSIIKLTSTAQPISNQTRSYLCSPSSALLLACTVCHIRFYCVSINSLLRLHSKNCCKIRSICSMPANAHPAVSTLPP